MNLRNLLFILFLIIVTKELQGLPEPAVGASLYGFVNDSTSVETVIGATVNIPELNKIAITNKSGYYSISNIPEGEYLVRVSFLGYKQFEQKVKFLQNSKNRVDYLLIPEVVKTEEKRIDRETDIFESLQMLPGVLTSAQGSNGMYIRGGTPDQNLVLLDGATVYQPTHLFGFYSSFSSDAIKDVEIFKGGYPAEFGRCLSSVVQVTQKEGNRNEFEGLASLGSLTSKLSIEGPLFNGSWFIGGRRTYFDLYKPLLDTDPNNPVQDIGFYDLNAKITQDIGSDDKISISGFISDDDFSLNKSGTAIDMFMGNKTGSLLWRHIFNESLFMVNNLTGSFYSNGMNLNLSGYNVKDKNSITDYTLKSSCEWFATDDLTAKFGIEVTNYIFEYEQEFSDSVGEEIQNVIRVVKLLEHDWNYSSFAQGNYIVYDGISMQAGLRVDYRDRSDYLTWDPRLGLRYELNDKIALKATWGIFHQYLRLAEVEDFSMIDTWMPTDESVKPSKAEHYILSIETKPFDNYEWSFDVYYKKLENISELNMNQLKVIHVNDFFFNGRGETYGFETFIHKKIGRFTGWAGYSIGFVNLQFDDINFGKWFRPKYDRIHDFTIVAQYSLNETWDFSANFTYQSGMSAGNPQSFYNERYNFRLPSSHQLNVNASYHYSFFGLPAKLIMDVYNVYNRKNFIMRYYNVTEESARIEDVRLLPIIPSISTEIRF